VIDELISRMKALLEPLEGAGDQRLYFHATYLRTTIAVAGEISRGGFADAAWVERWDVVFADLYLDALEGGKAGRGLSRPWVIAFGAPAGLPPLRHVLLGMNAHINYDLPQALVAVISDDQFDDAALLAGRQADHRAIDEVLASRVTAEEDELIRLSGPAPLLDRLLRPVSRLATQRFLREAREKVWANATMLSRARRQGPDAYAAVLAQLEELSAAKVTTLQAPGQVLLKLAVTGFGVRLPATPGMRLLRLIALFALYGLLDGHPQPILVRYRQVAPDQLQGLAFERVHDGINLAIRAQHHHRRCAWPQVAFNALDHGTVDDRVLESADEGGNLPALLVHVLQGGRLGRVLRPPEDGDIRQVDEVLGVQLLEPDHRGVGSLGIREPPCRCGHRSSFWPGNPGCSQMPTGSAFVSGAMISPQVPRRRHPWGVIAGRLRPL
jgi:hypothetical protein